MEEPNTLLPEFFAEGVSTNDGVSADDSFNITEPLMTDDEILSVVLDEQDSVTEEDKDDGLSNEHLFDDGASNFECIAKFHVIE